MFATGCFPKLGEDDTMALGEVAVDMAEPTSCRFLLQTKSNKNQPMFIITYYLIILIVTLYYLFIFKPVE